MTDIQNTERPDRDAARTALEKASTSDMLATASAVSENRRLVALVREARVRNHFADKFRTIITGTP
jgi:hypothetical protein